MQARNPNCWDGWETTLLCCRGSWSTWPCLSLTPEIVTPLSWEGLMMQRKLEGGRGVEQSHG